MPLLSGPLRLPVDLPYLDRYCYQEGEENGFVLLRCRSCASPSSFRYTVAFLGDAACAPAEATVVNDITGLIDVGMRHLAEYHPEP